MAKPARQSQGSTNRISESHFSLMSSSNSIRQLVVINVVGLTHEMIGENTPNIRRLLETGFARPMTTVLPAVTCTVQAT